MSIATRRMARALVTALIFAAAPVASAVAPSFGYEHVDARQPQRPLKWFELARLASENIAVAATAAAVEETERRRVEAAEDARVADRIQKQARRLTPGNYIWNPERADSGTVDIVVSLAAQRAYVFRARKLIAVSTVSTGRPGNETPTGVFPILERKRRHFSNLYNNAPMPNMQRMTWDGVALHAGAIPGRPASHGCVRLPLAFSDLLFGVTRAHTSVVHVIDGTPPSAAGALAFAASAAGTGSQTARAR